MTGAQQLASFVRRYPRLTVLTGAGISTPSGIPDYRDRDGQWKGATPIDYRDFVSKPAMRQRYWSRSIVGWPIMAASAPNVCHNAISGLQAAGFVERIVTQNVDTLHQRAGSSDVIDLHGRLDSVSCLDCDWQAPRADWQQRLAELNPDVAATAVSAQTRPDGDAVIDGIDLSQFVVPPCPRCHGVVKPDVVFFGENVPRERVSDAMAALAASDALLVLGSSLVLFSGFRFARAAHQRGQAIALVNLGINRADELATLKLDARCEDVLEPLPTLLSA
ncbi:MAG: NAD-dependent protein deacetylase [Pseudomonadota bacterium]